MGAARFEPVSPVFAEGNATASLERTSAGKERIRMGFAGTQMCVDPVMAEELADALDLILEWRENQQ